MTLVIPMVTWRDAREEWVVDLYSRLLQDRIIFVGTPIDEQIANLVVAELLHLESEQSDRDIAIYVNSPGGSVYAGLTIYDTMQFVRPDVQTTCVGIAMGMGALIVLGGTRGKRVALPHAKILLNQVSGGFEGEASDIEIQAREVLALGRRLEQIIAEHTGQPLEKVSKDTDRDFILTAPEAKEYGAVDEILSRRGLTAQVAGVSSNGA
jgi:ATP-dependent Clp protease, protease subunit